MHYHCPVLIDPLQPHELQTSRLLYPWNSPGKNTGMGCHFLLQQIYLIRDQISVSSVPCTGSRFFNTELPGNPKHLPQFSQFNSVAQSCLILCDPMNRSSPGLPVHHQLPEFTQTHVHRVSDSIQPSHPLSSPSPPAHNCPSIRVFSNESTLRIMWLKYWSFSFTISASKENPGRISFRMD